MRRLVVTREWTKKFICGRYHSIGMTSATTHPTPVIISPGLGYSLTRSTFLEADFRVQWHPQGFSYPYMELHPSAPLTTTYTNEGDPHPFYRSGIRFWVGLDLHSLTLFLQEAYTKRRNTIGDWTHLS
jgi:hypothetical protein